MTALDLQILMFIQENIRVDWLSSILVPYTVIGNKGLLWLVIALALAAYPKTRRIGIVAVVSFVVCSGVGHFVIKNLVMRPRPFIVSSEIVPLVTKPTSFSFPSGHTVTAFSVAFAVMYAAKGKWRWVLLFMALVMGLSRLYVGVHYPTDVLGGIVCAFVGTSLVWAWIRRYICTDAN